MIGRREFLFGRRPVMMAFGGPRSVQSGGAAQDTLAAPLVDPSMAGSARDRVTAGHNDPFIVGIERRLRCTCGCNLDVYTCRTTDFSCTTSPEMHRQVLALLDRGLTAEQVVQAFVDEHGQAVLMAPPKQGFNLAAYFVPGIAIVVASAVLWVVLRRWTRATAAAPAGAVATGAPQGSPDELARLQRELDEFSA